MKCPYCDHEMELGYIQCRDGIVWTKRKMPIAALSSLSGSATILALPGAAPFSGAAVEAYRCSHCKKVMISYDD